MHRLCGIHCICLASRRLFVYLLAIHLPLWSAKLIQNNPGAIFISDNSDIFIRTIKFLGQNEDGRRIINGARFLFINNFNENRVKELAKKYNFKYSFPKLDN